MLSQYYEIKKTRFSEKPIAMVGGLSFSIVYIIIQFMIILFIYLDYTESGDLENFLFAMFILSVFVGYGVCMLIHALKMEAVKKFKYNGKGILKVANVVGIGAAKIKSSFVYYFEAENSGIVYYSNGCEKGTLLGTSISNLEVLYKKYGFIYDEKQTQKGNLLGQIDEIIAKNEYEMENSGFILKSFKREKLNELKKDRQAVFEGYITPSWEIDGKKVTVGDAVDVYINPRNPKNYWVDTDFLFK